MHRAIINRITIFVRGNLYLLLGSLIFLFVQTIYSFLLWNRNGLPPTPGDSYNYITHIIAIINSGHIYVIPNETVHAGFNYLYPLICLISGLKPTIVYFLFFFVGKFILLGILIYFLTAFFSNQKITAFVLVLLAFYTGTGETHGFFWVVPSFWSVAFFFLLLGMAKNKENIILILAISILYLFIHPLSLYTVPVISCFTLVACLNQKKIIKPYIQLSICLLIAALFQQAFLHRIDYLITQGYSTQSSSLTQMDKVVQETVDNATTTKNDSSTPNLATAKTNFTNNSTTNLGVLSINSIVARALDGSANMEYDSITVPTSLVKIFPSLLYFWNGYLFYWLLSVYLLPLYIALIGWCIYFALKNKLELTLLFIIFLITSLLATFNTQGFRFLVFVWPLTYMAIAELCSKLFIPNAKKWVNISLRIYIIFLMLFDLIFGLYLTHRTGSLQNYTWDSNCINYALTHSLAGAPVLYSNANLSSTVFLAEGLASRPTVDIDQWVNYLEDNPIKQVIFIGDKDGSFLNNEAQHQKYIQTMNSIIAKRHTSLEYKSCGFFEINIEK